MLSSGAICGELTMLGIAPVRTASIIAKTLCTFWEVTQAQATTLLDDRPNELQMFANIVIRNLEHAVLGSIQKSRTFQHYDSKFKTLIYMCCDRRAYWGGTHITKVGQPGDGLYIVNRGLTMLSIESHTIHQGGDGFCYGAGIMLGLHKNCHCALIALNLCHVLVISKKHYLLAMDRYPNETAQKRLLAVTKKAVKVLMAKIEEKTNKDSLVSKTVMEQESAMQERANEFMTKVLQAWRVEAARSKKERVRWHRVNDNNKRLTDLRTVQNATGRERRKLKGLEKDYINHRGPALTLEVQEDDCDDDPHRQRRPRVRVQKTQEVLEFTEESHWKQAKIFGIVGSVVKHMQASVPPPMQAQPSCVSVASQSDHSLSEPYPDYLGLPSRVNGEDIGVEIYARGPFSVEDGPQKPRATCKQTPRERAALDDHQRRVKPVPPPPDARSPRFGKAQSMPPSFRNQRLSASSEGEWTDEEATKLPPVLQHLAPKSMVNAFVLKPVLRTSTIDGLGYP